MTKIATEGMPSAVELIKSKESKALEKIGEDFESFFITSMLKDMDKTTHFGKKKSYREETTMAIVYEKVGEHLGKKGLGIKDMLLKYTARDGNPKENTKVYDEKGDNKDE
jgi:Rod binding domain-containing protein